MRTFLRVELRNHVVCSCLTAKPNAKINSFNIFTPEDDITNNNTMNSTRSPYQQNSKYQQNQSYQTYNNTQQSTQKQLFKKYEAPSAAGSSFSSANNSNTTSSLTSTNSPSVNKNYSETPSVVKANFTVWNTALFLKNDTSTLFFVPIPASIVVGKRSASSGNKFHGVILQLQPNVIQSEQSSAATPSRKFLRLPMDQLGELLYFDVNSTNEAFIEDRSTRASKWLKISRESKPEQSGSSDEVILTMAAGRQGDAADSFAVGLSQFRFLQDNIKMSLPYLNGCAFTSDLYFNNNLITQEQSSQQQQYSSSQLQQQSTQQRQQSWNDQPNNSYNQLKYNSSNKSSYNNGNYKTNSQYHNNSYGSSNQDNADNFSSNSSIYTYSSNQNNSRSYPQKAGNGIGVTKTSNGQED